MSLLSAFFTIESKRPDRSYRFFIENTGFSVRVDKIDLFPEYKTWIALILIMTNCRYLISSLCELIRHFAKDFFRTTFCVHNTPNIY